MNTVTLPYSASRRLWFCRLWVHQKDRRTSVAHVDVVSVRDSDALELQVVDDHGGVGANVGDVELEGHEGSAGGEATITGRIGRVLESNPDRRPWWSRGTSTRRVAPLTLLLILGVVCEFPTTSFFRHSGVKSPMAMGALASRRQSLRLWFTACVRRRARDDSKKVVARTHRCQSLSGAGRRLRRPLRTSSLGAQPL